MTHGLRADPAGGPNREAIVRDNPPSILCAALINARNNEQGAAAR
jgi:hypothetical protein